MARNYILGLRLTAQPPEGSYLRNLPVVRSLAGMDTLSFTKPVTFLVGENGTGKSTLLEAIAVGLGFNPEGGTRNFNFATSDTHSSLHHCLSFIKSQSPEDGFFLRAESFYNTISYLDDIYSGEFSAGAPTVYGDRSLHEQSHGEGLLSLVQNRFGPNSLFLLDEPESALSPTRQMTLLAELHHLAGQNCQFIIATHSPIIMAFPGAEVLELSEGGIQSVDYRQTEHYQVTRRFLENPERMLHYLLEEHEDA